MWPALGPDGTIWEVLLSFDIVGEVVGILPCMSYLVLKHAPKLFQDDSQITECSTKLLHFVEIEVFVGNRNQKMPRFWKILFTGFKSDYFHNFSTRNIVVELYDFVIPCCRVRSSSHNPKRKFSKNGNVLVT